MKFTFLLLSLVLVTLAFAQDYIPTVIWDRSGETDSSAYGYKILPLGDQNDDGFADWAVFAQGNGSVSEGQQPYLEFFHGSETLDSVPYNTYRADSTVYRQNWFAFSAGDVNGDGYQDWLIRLWQQSLPPDYTIFLFYGGPNTDNVPDILLSIPIGSGFHQLGDFTGDGYDDLYWSNNDASTRIYYGGSPLDTTVDWFLHQPPPGINSSFPYAIGDFTGDGASDFLCFNPNNDSVAIFLGGAQPDTIPDYLWGNITHGAIGGVRDLNYDGYDEFLFRSNSQVFVHLGGETLSSTPNFTLNFSCPAGSLMPVSAGDFNDDSYDDLILLTSSCVDNMFGSLTLHLGYSWLNAEPIFIVDGWTPPLDLIGIYSAAGLGDVNGDGIDDIAIGAWDDFAWQGWRGRCVILAGDDTLAVSTDNSRPELAEELAIDIYPNPFNSGTTIRLEAPLSQDQVTLSIYNVLGQEVQHETFKPISGEYNYYLNAQDLTTGLYFVHAESGEFHTTQKLMLLR